MEIEENQQIKEKDISADLQNGKDVSSVDLSENTNNCICGEPDDDRFMIICDVCDTWFHGICVGIDVIHAKDVIEYHCVRCEKSHGPSKMKPKRKSGRKKEEMNYADISNGTGYRSKPNSRREFLESKTFSDSPFLSMDGSEFTLDHIKSFGFTEPLIFHNVDGLDMKMPKAQITVMEIAEMVGDVPIEVMDVSTQESLSGWTFSKWAKYFTHVPLRKNIYNVISFEISDTPFGKDILRPRIVRDLDWMENCWPTDSLKKEFPKVQLYCLMSPAESWTEFHIDFGGTSVFYHLLSGKKSFLLIPPTDKNLALYEKWCKSPDQNLTFFADLVKRCYKVDLSAGDTMFIPSGWIHAVYTSKDAIVIGGNFVHSFSIETQLKVYEIEKRCQVPPKYRFPYYEKLCWYALMRMSQIYDESKLTQREVDGLQALCDFLYQQTIRLSKQTAIESAPQKMKLAAEDKKAIKDAIPEEFITDNKYKQVLTDLSLKIADKTIEIAPNIGSPKKRNYKNNSRPLASSAKMFQGPQPISNYWSVPNQKVAIPRYLTPQFHPVLRMMLYPVHVPIPVNPSNPSAGSTLVLQWVPEAAFNPATLQSMTNPPNFPSNNNTLFVAEKEVGASTTEANLTLKHEQSKAEDMIEEEQIVKRQKLDVSNEM